jgi:hypothetical protein
MGDYLDYLGEQMWTQEVWIRKKERICQRERDVTMEAEVGVS